MSTSVPPSKNSTAKNECDTLGCRYTPVGGGFCKDCITISPGVVDHEDVGPWVGVEFDNPDSETWPSSARDRKQWMGHIGKRPFAPWGERDAPAPCSESGHDTAADCSCDARWKWSFSDNYTTYKEIDGYYCLDGRVFIQREDDPFAFVDGDNVRDPKTGEVHPEFVAILDKLGFTYGDVSQSGEGVHGFYRGELPDGMPEATWQLDSTPFGSNNDPPSVEIYSGNHVCVMTGERLPGTPEFARQWDDEGLREVLDDADKSPKSTLSTTTEFDDFDSDDWEPDATSSNETTGDIRDVFAALDSLDAQHVADKTIVHSWNETAITSSGTRAFSPTWGKNSNGTANIVDGRIWQDTGDEGGYGGAVIMALIDLGEISHRDVNPRQASGSTWWTGVDHLRDLGFDIPEYEDGSRSEDLAALLPATEDHTDDKDRHGGLTIDTARDQTREAIADAYQSDDHRLIEALPTMGKSYGSVEAAAETGELISILTTRGREEQYRQIEEWCDEHDLTSKVLPSVMRDCPVFAGETDEGRKGTVEKWYHNGASGSEIHQIAERELGGPLPCERQAGERCGFKASWEFEPDEFDVLIGNYVHANASRVTDGRTVVVDEFPAAAFEDKLDGQLSSAVSGFLSETESLPFDNYADLLEKRYDPVKEEQALEFFEEHEPERDSNQAISPDGHALAPLAVYTLLAGEELGNEWERASLPESGHVGLFDRERGNVYLLTPPTFDEASAVVGLDGTPTPSLWNIALGEDLDHDEVLDNEEKSKAYIRKCLSFDIIQTSDARKPYSSGEWVNVEKDHTLLEAVADKHEEKPSLLTTNAAVETYKSSSEAVLSNVDDHDHYPIEGSNEFGEKRVGAVVGSPHYGDRFLEKWGAYADEAVESCRGSGDLEYTGVGEDIYRHMARNQTLQAVMRFGRDSNGATVYVHTSALPEWVPVAGEGTVSTFGDKQRSILQSVMDQDGEFACRELDSPASSRWTREFLKSLTEAGYVDREKRHGRFYYTVCEDNRPRGLVDITQ